MNPQRSKLATQITNGELAMLNTADERTRRALDARLMALRDELDRMDGEPPAPVEPPFTAVRLDFIERHGNAPVSAERGVLLFADAARLVTSPMGKETLFDPPADPGQCLEARRRYHELRLEPAERDFNLLRAALSGEGVPFRWREEQDKTYGKATGDGEADLKRIQAVVLAQREAIAAIDDALYHLPSQVELRALQARQRAEAMEQAARVNEAHARIRAVTI